MNRGIFCTFEGADLTGKSLQARKLAKYLRKHGVPVKETREPGGSGSAEELRALLLSNDHDWSPREEALIFAAARAHHVRTIIKPAISSGAWVICDRYVDSSKAYQAYAGNLSPSDIDMLHAFGSQDYLPDLTIMFSVSENERALRLMQRGGPIDRMEAKGASFQAQVHEGFKAIARDNPERVCIIDGEGSEDEVFMRVIQCLEARGVLIPA